MYVSKWHKWGGEHYPPFKLSPVYSGLHQLGERAAYFMLNAKGLSVA